MEMVRQLFSYLLDAFWHRFVLTRHSGVFANPKYEITIPKRPPNIFAAFYRTHRQ